MGGPRLLERHAPETCGTRARILEVTRSDGGSSPLRSVAEVLGDLARPFGAPASWSESVARRLAAREVTLAFLKQFRDVEHTDRACYQAIIEAKATVRKLRGDGPLPGTLRVTAGPIMRATRLRPI